MFDNIKKFFNDCEIEALNAKLDDADYEICNLRKTNEFLSVKLAEAKEKIKHLEYVNNLKSSFRKSTDDMHLSLIKTRITLDFMSKTGIATDGPAWYVLKVTSNEFKEAIGKDTLVHVLDGYGLFKRKVGNFKSLGAE